MLISKIQREDIKGSEVLYEDEQYEFVSINHSEETQRRNKKSRGHRFFHDR